MNRGLRGLHASSQAPQAFWSAPGSTYTGHHAYPGGLAVHEWLNARIAKAFVEGYDAIYHLSSDPKAIDASIAQAAPLWHDIHKVTVFQWRADGSELVEYPIADTGAHHPLSGAEAILRGLPLPFVIALLSAHDAPTTVKSNSTQTGLQRLVNYIRAAAIIARRDPVALGLLQRASDGRFQLSQDPPRIEGHINHLSDHDYLFSNDSAATLIGTLRQVAVDYGIDPARQEPRFNLFRNLVFAQVSDIRLYGCAPDKRPPRREGRHRPRGRSQSALRLRAVQLRRCGQFSCQLSAPRVLPGRGVNRDVAHPQALGLPAWWRGVGFASCLARHR